MPVGSGALGPAGGPRSPVLGEDMGSALPSGADLAAAFAQSTAAQDLGAAVGMDFETPGSDAAAAAAVAPAAPPAPKPARGCGRGRQGAHHQRRSVDAVLQELHSQVGGLHLLMLLFTASCFVSCFLYHTRGCKRSSFRKHL
jgi:hypothetical protein